MPAAKEGEIEEVEDDFDDTTPTGMSRHRSGSMSSPPLPPPFFNPPADSSIPPVEAVTPPSSGHNSASSSSMSISQQLGATGHQVSLAAAAAVASQSTTRPRLEAFQRLSTESIPSPGSYNSSASGQSAGWGPSEGGSHLAEARETLLQSAVSSEQTSRRNSDTAEQAQRSFEMHVTNPTPPIQPLDYEDEVIEAGPSRPRRTSSPPPVDGHDLSAEHAWDSVWPAPGSAHRPQLAHDSSKSHFPTAPLSPFVTPAFSPAIIPPGSVPRKPASPGMSPSDPSSPQRRSHSPSRRPSPRHSAGGRSPILSNQVGSPDPFPLGRRRSITANSPLLAHSPPKSSPITISRHQRSFSGSSSSVTQRPPFRDTLDRTIYSPSFSPPTSPNARSVPLKSSKSSDSPGPGSPVAGRVSRNNATSYKDGDAIYPSGLLLTKSSGRPRGRSLSSVQVSTSEPGGLALSVVPSSGQSASPRNQTSPSVVASLSSSSLPPMFLPPAVTSAPVLPPPTGGDDGLPTNWPTYAASAPLFVPSARPAYLRRAMSDYDPRVRHAPVLNRSLSITADLDKSPKRTTGAAEIVSPVSPRLAAEADVTRTKKSPRRSPNTLPTKTSLPDVDPTIPPLHINTYQSPDAPISLSGGGDFDFSQVGDINLVDAGDVLPDVDFQMDVTFDDEGLNTLERIFLLAKSEFPFHRAYVARVLGDLLVDVDPCESVEYVLPLLSGFSIDDDESVKEAFASELHRILWYFFSSCKLLTDEGHEGELAGVEYRPSTETITITSEGVDVVPKQVVAEADITATIQRRSGSMLSGAGPSTGGSTTAHSSSFSPAAEGSTPATTYIETPSSVGTAFSPSAYVNPYADEAGSEKGWAKDVGPLVDRPQLAVSFFTPLLGSLLLNSNPTISESVRNGLVHIIARIRGKVEPQPEIWGHDACGPEVDERRTFASQNGPHAHDIRPFSPITKQMVERELINGIIIGMGKLSIEMPEGLFNDSLEEGNRVQEMYAEHHGGSMAGGPSESEPTQAELFQEQLIAEATAGRATSMNLIGALCEYYSPRELVTTGFVDEVLKSCDGDVLVRSEGAVALSCLAKLVETEQIYNLIPLFESFMFDPTDHVRQSVCLSLPVLCRRIESQEYKRNFAVQAVTTLADSGEDVRCAVLEMLGEVIYVFHEDPGGPPAELLEVYMRDFAGSDDAIDDDWDIVAAFNLPGVLLTIGADRWDDLRILYHRLQRRGSDKIMRILAASLHELAKILHVDQVEEDLIPVYQRCLTCDDEIRERVYENVNVIVTRVNPQLGWEMFEGLATAWAKGNLGGWRAREQLALHLPSFLETFPGLAQGERILDVLHDALVDPFAAVRDAVTKKMPQAYIVVGHESAIAAKYRNMLLELGNSGSYRQRLTFVRCLREFSQPPPNQEAFESFFAPALPRLAQDVVDVRIGLAQVIANLFVVGAYYGDESVPIPSVVTQLVHTLTEDESEDVRTTIRHVRLDRPRQGEEAPHRIESSEPNPNRALKPGDRGPGVQNASLADYRLGSSRSSEVTSQLDTMQIDDDDQAATSTSMEMTPLAEPLTSPRLRLGSDPFSQSFKLGLSDEAEERND